MPRHTLVLALVLLVVLLAAARWMVDAVAVCRRVLARALSPGAG